MIVRAGATFVDPENPPTSLPPVPSRRQLTAAQIGEYHREGFLLVRNVFSREEVQQLLSAFEEDARLPGPHRIMEEGNDRVRAVYASHLRRAEFRDLLCDPRVLGSVHQLLADNVYAYQYKIHAKSPCTGEGWDWHQDYLAWRILDEVPSPRMLNVALFLDPMTESNGPINFIPRSHHRLICKERSGQRSDNHLDPADIALTDRDLETLKAHHGVITMTGTAGSLLFFHPLVIHGSEPNRSMQARRVAFITFNDVQNQPRTARPRAEYLVGRDTRSLQIRPLIFGT